MLVAISSISSVSWRSSLYGGSQGHEDADGKLDEHLVYSLKSTSVQFALVASDGTRTLMLCIFLRVYFPCTGNRKC